MKEIVAVIQFPGSNCEEETHYACQSAGMDSEIFHWLRNPDELNDFAGFILPGGFAHQDRVRAGAIAAKERIMDEICELAMKGRAVLGICNGAQVLVEAGLIPGISFARVEMALAENNMKDRWGFFHRFAFIRSSSPKGSSLINHTIEEGEIIPIPIAHAEGRFTTTDNTVIKSIEDGTHSTFKYCDCKGNVVGEYPINPNGAIHSLASLSNIAGNIVAIMPHPERSAFLRQIPPDIWGEWGELRRKINYLNDENVGPGMKIFISFREFIKSL